MVKDETRDEPLSDHDGQVHVFDEGRLDVTSTGAATSMGSTARRDGGRRRRREMGKSVTPPNVPRFHRRLDGRAARRWVLAASAIAIAVIAPTNGPLTQLGFTQSRR